MATFCSPLLSLWRHQYLYSHVLCRVQWACCKQVGGNRSADSGFEAKWGSDQKQVPMRSTLMNVWIRIGSRRPGSRNGCALWNLYQRVVIDSDVQLNVKGGYVSPDFAMHIYTSQQGTLSMCKTDLSLQVDRLYVYVCRPLSTRHHRDKSKFDARCKKTNALKYEFACTGKYV
jgi:hypothetical protein